VLQQIQVVFQRTVYQTDKHGIVEKFPPVDSRNIDSIRVFGDCGTIFGGQIQMGSAIVFTRSAAHNGNKYQGEANDPLDGKSMFVFVFHGTTVIYFSYLLALSG